MPSNKCNFSSVISVDCHVRPVLGRETNKKWLRWGRGVRIEHDTKRHQEGFRVVAKGKLRLRLTVTRTVEEDS